MKDFSIEKSFESICTDSSMRSNYDEKLAEAKKFDKEIEEEKLKRTVSVFAKYSSSDVLMGL